MKTYKVNEIFYSLQGEGSYTGTPMVFIRFAGCNLNCAFCDTEHEEGADMTKEKILLYIEAITQDAESQKDIPICFTGGEPTLQIDEELITFFTLEKDWHRLCIETNGTVRIPCVEYFEHITISPKGRPERWVYEEEHLLDDLKIVFDRGNPSLSREMEVWKEITGFDNMYLQPLALVDGTTNVEKVIDYVMKHPEWSLSLQVQKILGII